MKPQYKYDPEDIESLLLNKAFEDLYPEEKEFVLRHVETAEEYESLRKTIFELHKNTDGEDWLEPDSKLKKELLAEFASEEKSGFRIWLNSLFYQREKTWYRQPAWLALGGVCILIGLLFFVNSGKQQTVDFAENKIETPPADSAMSDTARDTSSANADVPKEMEAEIQDSDKALPPPPKPTVSEAPALLEFESIESVDDDSFAKEELAPAINKIDAPTEMPIAFSADDVAKKTNAAGSGAIAGETQHSQSEKSVQPTKEQLMADVKSAESNVNSKSLTEVKNWLKYLYTAQ